MGIPWLKLSRREWLILGALVTPGLILAAVELAPVIRSWSTWLAWFR